MSCIIRSFAGRMLAYTVMKVCIYPRWGTTSFERISGSVFCPSGDKLYPSPFHMRQGFLLLSCLFLWGALCAGGIFEQKRDSRLQFFGKTASVIR